MLFLLFWIILIVLTHPMLPFSCLIILLQQCLEKNKWKENFLWKKISPKKILFFLRFFSFSLYLCKFSFIMFLMKPSLYVFLLNWWMKKGIIHFKMHTIWGRQDAAANVKMKIQHCCSWISYFSLELLVCNSKRNRNVYYTRSKINPKYGSFYILKRQ